MEKIEGIRSQIKNLHKYKREQPNAMVFVDYENIHRRLLDYGKSVVDEDIIHKIKEYAYNVGLNVLNFYIFANFDNEDFHKTFHQTSLQSQGVTTRHTPNNGKNSSDIQMVVEVMRVLFLNEDVDVFVIISSDRDMIPLLQALKHHNKITFLITTKAGFEKNMINFADNHDYLEDIIDLDIDYLNIDVKFTEEDITEKDMENSKQVLILLITSKIWERHMRHGSPINFEEYKKHIVAASKFSEKEVDRLFEIAHLLGWIKLYIIIRNNENVTAVTIGDNLTKEFIKELVGNKYVNLNSYLNS
jgi:uncharacterized protein (TIGR00288 family)